MLTLRQDFVSNTLLVIVAILKVLRNLFQTFHLAISTGRDLKQWYLLNLKLFAVLHRVIACQIQLGLTFFSANKFHQQLAHSVCVINIK